MVIVLSSPAAIRSNRMAVGARAMMATLITTPTTTTTTGIDSPAGPS